jgi:hypothetical protein
MFVLRRTATNWCACRTGGWGILKPGGPAATHSGTRSTTPDGSGPAPPGEIDAGETGGNMSEEQTLRQIFSEPLTSAAVVVPEHGVSDDADYDVADVEDEDEEDEDLDEEDDDLEDEDEEDEDVDDDEDEDEEDEDEEDEDVDEDLDDEDVDEEDEEEEE